MPVKKALIDEFLGLKRIAVVGVSRNPKDFTQTMWQEFRQRRYDAVPVNPNTTEIDGKQCFARVQEIDPPVQAALVMTSASAAEQVVKDCADAGIKLVWLYGGATRGSGSPEAIKAAQELGIEVIYGQCPYMFFADTPVMHKWHGGWKKLTRSYPVSSN